LNEPNPQDEQGRDPELERESERSQGPESEQKPETGSEPTAKRSWEPQSLWRRKGQPRTFQVQLRRGATGSYLSLKLECESRIHLMKAIHEGYPGWQLRRVRVVDAG